MRGLAFILSLLFIVQTALADDTQLFKIFRVPDEMSLQHVATGEIEYASKEAKNYKSAFEALYSNALTGMDPDQMVAERFLVMTTGCGTECQVVGLLDVSGIDGQNNPKRPKAYLLSVVASYGVKSIRKSRLLIVNPKSETSEIFGEEVLQYAKSKYYFISDDAQAYEIFPE